MPKTEQPKRKRGQPTKYKPEYNEIAAKLCARGLTDDEIAETLGVSDRTMRLWKLAHEGFAAAFKRSNEVICDQLEETMRMRANGFTRKVEKATASGRVVTVTEYFPPDVQAGRFILQHRRPEVFRDQREVKQLVGVEEGFLKFLQRLDDKAKLERETGDLPVLLEHQPIEDAVIIEEDEGEA